MDERRYWDARAGQYDRLMQVLGGPLPAAAAAVGEWVDGREDVLELAAGTGAISQGYLGRVGRARITDFAPAMVEQLQARLGDRPEVVIEQLDLYALPGEPTHDAIVAANLLHLLPDLPGALEILRASLRPDGLLLVPTYCHAETVLAGATSRLMGLAGFPGRRRFTVQSLTETVAGAGLEVVHSERFAGLLPIGLVVARR